MKGAGGTNGGTGQFIIGFIMICVGFYMLFNAITVSSHFGIRTGLFAFNFFGTTRSINTGMVLVPFIFGISMIFYNAKNIIGWLLTIGSLAAVIFGVISSLSIHMKTMSLFEILTIIVLSFGGIGLFLSSLREK